MYILFNRTKYITVYWTPL